MTKYARVVDNVAVEIFVPPQGVSIDECFHPEVVKMFKAVPDATAVNAVKDGTKWINPTIEV
jgi:hypothetical protein